MPGQSGKRLFVSALGAVALLAYAPAALAAAATASASVNVRAGPGTSFAVLTQLRPGESVDISQCKGTFCYVTHEGTPGWVSANYLTRGTVPAPTIAKAAPPAVPPPAYASPEVSVTIADDGADPAFEPPFGNRYPRDFDRFGLRARLAPVPGGDRPDRACFFENGGFFGPSFCVAAGETLNDVESTYGPVASIRNPVGLRVTLCDDFRDCRVYRSSVVDLRAFGNRVDSISIE